MKRSLPAGIVALVALLILVGLGRAADTVPGQYAETYQELKNRLDTWPSTRNSPKRYAGEG